MRIVYVVGEVPWPLCTGYLRHFHFLRALSARHEVTLLALTRRSEVSAEAVDVLSPLVARLQVFGVAGPGWSRVRREAHLRRSARRLARALEELLAVERFDAVLLSAGGNLPAIDAVGDVPLVVDVCDAASLRALGELRVARARRVPILAARIAELRRAERRLHARTPHLLFASERDRAAVLGATGGGEVLPNGVDLEHWSRRTPPSRAARVAFTGVMRFRPNEDAALRLVDRILPLIRAAVPDVELVLAGRDPRPALVTAARGRPGVVLTGARPDLRPDVESAAVFCAPLRFASGIQNKLLEAMALEVPVVTTPVAAAGLRINGEVPPVLVARDDAELAAAVVRLLRDPSERERLGTAGRRYVERHFSWERSTAALEATLERATTGSRRRPFTVALIGCDGAGKTTVARRLESDPSIGARYLYMGVSPDSSNRQLPTTRLAHAVKRARCAPPDTAGPQERTPSPPPRSLARRLRRGARSTLRLANRLAEEWYRQLLAVGYLRRGQVVVFDRHFVADFHAADVAGNGRTLHRRIHGLLLQRAYPRPDLTILLDAPPDVLYARKGEGTPASLARRRAEYLQLAEVTPNFAVVPAARALDDVVDDVAALVRAFGRQERRAA